MNQDQDLQQTDEETFILPDEALAEAAAAGTPVAADALTRERLDELNVDASSAKPEELALLKDYVLGDRKWPDPVVATETPDEAAERTANEEAVDETVAPAAAAASESTAEDEDADEIDLEAGREQVTSINALRASHKSEMERLNAIIKAPKPDDKYSAEYEAWQEARDAAIIEKGDKQEEFQDKLAEATANGRERGIAVRESERFMKGFDAVSAKHAEVKLDRPFKVANAAYASWLDSLVAKAGITEGTPAEKMNAAYIKYQSDPTFAATVPAPKDLAQVQILNKARMLVDAVGGKRTLEGAVLEVLSTEGLLDKRTSAAAAAASQANAERTQAALRRAQTAPQTAPLSGASKAPKVLAVPVDVETATAYMTNLLDKRGKNRPLTPFETRHEDEAKALIGLDKVR